MATLPGSPACQTSLQILDLLAVLHTHAHTHTVGSVSLENSNALSVSLVYFPATLCYELPAASPKPRDSRHLGFSTQTSFPGQNCRCVAPCPPPRSASFSSFDRSPASCTPRSAPRCPSPRLPRQRVPTRVIYHRVLNVHLCPLLLHPGTP